MTIELWTWNTPHGRKIGVALKEMACRARCGPEVERLT
jgi:hypothetical protein